MTVNILGPELIRLVLIIVLGFREVEYIWIVYSIFLYTFFTLTSYRFLDYLNFAMTIHFNEFETLYIVNDFEVFYLSQALLGLSILRLTF